MALDTTFASGTPCRERPRRAGEIALALLSAAVLGAAAAGCGRAPGVPGGPLTIVAEPGRLGTIEEAAESERRVDWRDAALEDDAACTESFAAVDLRRFLAASLGVPERAIALATPAGFPEHGTAIVLGSAVKSLDLGAPTGAPELPLENDGFRIYPTRRRGVRTLVLEGRGRAGTLAAAYALLEQLGVRFYGLGPQGTVLPAARPDSIPFVAFSDRPAFRTRGFWVWEPRGDVELFLWMARNRMNLWTANSEHVPLLRKLGMQLTQGGHMIQKRFLDPAAEFPYVAAGQPQRPGIPSDPYAPAPGGSHDLDRDGRISYFEAHPEWYGLAGGRRSADVGEERGVNYCTSNPDATSELARRLVRDVSAGDWRDADVLALWMLDDGTWCACARCAALGSPTDRLFRVLERVRQELDRARAEGTLTRAVRTTSLAFLETADPPVRAVAPAMERGDHAVTFFPIDRCYAHGLADSECTEINRPTRDELLAWAASSDRRYRGPVEIGEYYNVSSLKSLPVLYTRVMAEDLAWYYSLGMRDFHYMHVPLREWGPWTLNHAVLSRLLWNPARPVAEIRDEYFRLYYPRTAATTRVFYEQLETATANLKILKHRARVDGKIFRLAFQFRAGLLPLPLEHLRYEPHHPTQNDAPDLVEMVERLAAARVALDRALAARPPEPERSRLLEDERRLAYLEATLTFFDRLIWLRMLELAGEPVAAAREWSNLRLAAENLRGMRDVAQISSSHANAADGLDATEVADLYAEIARRYESAALPGR